MEIIPRGGFSFNGTWKRRKIRKYDRKATFSPALPASLPTNRPRCAVPVGAWSVGELRSHAGAWERGVFIYPFIVRLIVSISSAVSSVFPAAAFSRAWAASRAPQRTQMMPGWEKVQAMTIWPMVA